LIYQDVADLLIGVKIASKQSCSIMEVNLNFFILDNSSHGNRSTIKINSNIQNINGGGGCFKTHAILWASNGGYAKYPCLISFISVEEPVFHTGQRRTILLKTV
jgi:hypothetical protein